jgi:hypothetical protein
MTAGKYSVKIKNNIPKEIAKLKELQKYTIRNGVLGNKTARKEGELTNAFLLLLHTLGSITQNIPSRPVLDAIEIKLKEFDLDAQKVVKKFTQNQLDAITTARQIGAIVLHYSLLSFETKGFGRWAELRPATIKAKNSNAILIESGEMRRAITFDVITK